MGQNPLNIKEKNSKKNFFGAIYPGTKSPFLRPKKFSNFFWLQLVPGTTIEIKNKKTQVIPSKKIKKKFRKSTLRTFFRN
jgi:hypothetical protein